MAKWEYLRLDTDSSHWNWSKPGKALIRVGKTMSEMKDVFILDIFDQLGAEGWELVQHVYSTGGQSMCLFKREKS